MIDPKTYGEASKKLQPSGPLKSRSLASDLVHLGSGDKPQHVGVRRSSASILPDALSMWCAKTEASVGEMIDEAKRSISAGQHHWKRAAELLARAVELGAAQRQIADAIGKSPAWVNSLLKWQKGGCQLTPFGPSSRASRVRRSNLQATERDVLDERQFDPTGSDLIRNAVSPLGQKLPSVSTVAEVSLARVPTPEQAVRFPGEPARGGTLGTHRALLIEALNKLAGSSVAEREAACIVVEEIRSEINLPWDDLLIQADRPSGK